MNTSIVVGSNGQDGRILIDQLSSRGDRILGIDTNGVRNFGITWDRSIDILKQSDVSSLLSTLTPDFIYYLAAYHHSSEDPIPNDLELFTKSYAVNVLGLLHFLDGIRVNSVKTKLFYASSSLIFGTPDSVTQDENTPFAPDTVYGITKLDGLLLCRYFRGRHNVFAASGILYNHESPYRSENFISKKIIKAAVNIFHGRSVPLVLGSLDAEVDWGYAPDYVDAMTRIMTLEKADDFIIATGVKHSVRDFVEIAFGYLGLDWKTHVQSAPGITTRIRKTMAGNSDKLNRLTGWQPTVDFKGMIKLLLRAEGITV